MGCGAYFGVWEMLVYAVVAEKSAIASSVW